MAIKGGKHGWCHVATNNWWSIGHDGRRVVVCDSQVHGGGGPMVASV